MKKIAIMILCLSVIFGVYGQTKEIKRSKLPNLAAKSTSLFTNETKKGQVEGYNDDKANSIEPFGVIKGTENWGSGTFVEDGKRMIFSQTHTWKPFNEYFGHITDVTFKFYDENMNVMKTVWLDVPDTTQVVTVLGQFSTRIFNNDMKFEFAVHVHYFTSDEFPYNVRDDVYIVNEDGDIVRKITQCHGLSLMAKGSSYAALVYKQFPNNYTHESGANLIIEARNPKTWDMEHEFSISEILTAYSDGYCFDVIDIEGVPYIFTAHYEIPWAASDGSPDEETGEWSDPIPNLNNHYVITLYDLDYKVVKEMKFDLIGIEEHSLSFASFGFFSAMKYDITKNVYNNDDKFEIVYGMSRYIISCDCDMLEYYLLDEDGKEMRRMDYSIMQSYNVSPVKGFNDQVVLILPEGEGGGTFRFIDAITWDIVADFEGFYKNELLSFNFDRIAFGDSYAYAFGLGQAEMIGLDAYGGIVCYNSDGREVKRFRFLLPEDVALWQPIVTAETMNPYTFDVDDKMEILSFMKQSAPNNKVISSFNIWKENGDVVSQWKSNNTDGTLTGAGFLYKNEAPDILYVGFKNETTDLVNASLYSLPFAIFSGGGDGTAENPYVISNVRELEMVRTQLKSHFILANDIDLKDYSSLNADGWLPIANFAGSLNGNGKVIKNMKITNVSGGMYSGLFANTEEGSVIKNLTLKDVNINGNEICSGAIAGQILGSTIIGCHATGNIKNTSSIGGIVGQSILFSSVSDCSFEGTIESEGSDNMGGIVGEIKTSSPVTRCFSKGEVKGYNNIGGIVGSATSGSTVTDCYSSMNVSGIRDLGGIIGYTGSCLVSRNYSTGTINAIAPEIGFTGRAGGIVGYNAWGPSIVVEYNVAVNEKVTAKSQAHRICGSEDEGELVNNYANSAMLVGAVGSEATVTSTENSSLEGADKAIIDMNKAFFEGLTWKFGNDTENPWVGESGLPRLWFEFAVNNIELDKKELTLNKIGATAQLIATVYPEIAINKNVTWASSNEAVATVSATGLVTAIGSGEAIITVTTEDGGLKANCNITVYVPVTGVELNKESLEFVFNAVKGETEQLIATITPEDATNKAVVWSSSNTSVAVVDQTGKVTAKLRKGTAVITVTTVDGNFKATCDVTVDIIDGVNDVNGNNIKLYHVDGRIVIESEVELSTVYVYDISGKLIFNQNSKSISTNNWNNGIYIVRMIDVNSNIISRKINVM